MKPLMILLIRIIMVHQIFIVEFKHYHIITKLIYVNLEYPIIIIMPFHSLNLYSLFRLFKD